jgi:uncharacterized pyridoxamine 5'-phosphate oxidase family protein
MLERGKSELEKETKRVGQILLVHLEDNFVTDNKLYFVTHPKREMFQIITGNSNAMCTSRHTLNSFMVLISSHKQP